MQNHVVYPTSLIVIEILDKEWVVVDTIFCLPTICVPDPKISNISCGSLAFVCIFSSLFTCSCMCLCLLFCVIKHSSYPRSCVGSYPSLYTRSQASFRSFALWHRCCLYSNIMDLQTPNPNPHFSLKDTLSLFACLTTCLLASSHAFFHCLLISMSPFHCLLTLLVCFIISMFLCYLYACLLPFCFPCLLHVHTKCGCNIKMQTKG